jgi:hypothetical protein
VLIRSVLIVDLCSLAGPEAVWLGRSGLAGPEAVIEVRQRVVARFVTVVCPPPVVPGPARTDDTIREFDQFFAALAPLARRALSAMLVTVDQGARLYPRARGRRFADLDDRTADAYLGMLLARSGTLQRLKGIFVMCYYELPEAKREIGYLPGPYIEQVSRRRLELHGDDIRAASGSGEQP